MEYPRKFPALRFLSIDCCLKLASTSLLCYPVGESTGQGCLAAKLKLGITGLKPQNGRARLNPSYCMQHTVMRTLQFQ